MDLGSVHQLAQLCPARVRLSFVDVLAFRDVVEGDPAVRAQARAVRPAEQRLRERKGDRVMGPGGDVQLFLGDVRARKFLVARSGLVHFPRFDLDLKLGRSQATHAAAVKRCLELEPERVARRCPRDVQAARRGLRPEVIRLTTEQERLEYEL